MGHNVSERRARELELAERSRAQSGWVVQKDGTVDLPQTPAGVLARGSKLTGRCGRRPDCGRRVTFDAAMWCRSGHALTRLEDVLDSYRCGLLPCRLDWAPEIYPGGPPLGAHLSDAGAHVTVACDCGGFRPLGFSVRRFAELVAQASGPTALIIPPVPPIPREGPLRYPPRLIRGACPACGERRWRILVAPTPRPRALDR